MIDTNKIEHLRFNIENSDINQKILSLNWRHRIKIDNNYYTPGTRVENEWEECFLPDNLTNKTFLDVGANDGMYSFLAEQKGALKVVATDRYITENETWDMTEGWGAHKIQFAKEALRSKIDIKPISIYDLDQLNQTFDVVYCGNVLAWLKSPLIALEKLSGVCKQTLYIREDIFENLDETPVLQYVNNDPSTCLFNGNKPYYIKTLTQLGFKNIVFKKVDEEKTHANIESNFPNIEILKGMQIYKNPWDISPKILSKNTSGKLSAIVAGKAYLSSFENSFWVNESDILFKNHHYKNTFAKRIFVRLLGEPLYLKIKNSFLKNKKTTLNYIIIANR